VPELKMPPVNQLKGRPLGRIFIKMGLLQRTQVHEALTIQKERKGPIGEILVELGHVTKEDLQRALAAQIGMETVDLSKIDVSREVINLIPAQMANTYNVVPIDYKAEENLLIVALDSPDNFQATDDLKTLMGFNVRPVIATSESIAKALSVYYPEDGTGSVSDLISEIGEDDDLSQFEGRGQSIDLDELKDLVEANPVKKLLNLVLLQAIRDKASDIHFEPL